MTQKIVLIPRWEAAGAHVTVATIIPLMVTFLSTGCSNKTDQHPTIPSLNVVFPMKGYRLARLSGGDPAEVGALVALKGGEMIWIKKPKDLEGIVVIRTNQHALSFCRLFTAEDTFLCMNEIAPGVSNVLEVLPKGSTEEKERLLDYPPGIFIDRRTFDGLKLQPPKIQKSEDYFVVERNLARRTKHEKIVLYRSLETVWEDGRYSHKVEKVLAEGDLPSIVWPMFE